MGTDPQTGNPEERMMNTRQAIEILSDAAQGDERYEAVLTLADPVSFVSIHGDPDESICEWLADRAYIGNETVGDLAADWDRKAREEIVKTALEVLAGTRQGTADAAYRALCAVIEAGSAYSDPVEAI